MFRLPAKYLLAEGETETMGLISSSSYNVARKVDVIASQFANMYRRLDVIHSGHCYGAIVHVIDWLFPC